MNPSYHFAMQEEHQYDYIQDNGHDIVMDFITSDRRGEGYNTQDDIIIKPNPSYSLNETTTKLSENEDGEDGYLSIITHTAQGEDCKVTGDVVNSDIDSGVAINPNPSYEVVSGGVNLEDNPSYSKMKHT